MEPTNDVLKRIYDNLYAKQKASFVSPLFEAGYHLALAQAQQEILSEMLNAWGIEIKEAQK